MDWEVFSRVSHRTLDRARKVTSGVVGDSKVFYVERLSGASGFAESMKYLSGCRTCRGEPLKSGTIRSYLSAVCHLLSVAGAENGSYCESIRGYERSMVREYDPKVKEILERVMHKGGKDMAVIASLIYYNCPKLLQIKYLQSTRCDVNNGVDSYMDLDGGMFYANEEGYVSKECSLPMLFTEFVRELKVGVWLLGSKRTSAQSISNMFSRCAGMSYKMLKSKYVFEDDITEEVEQLAEPTLSQPKGSEVLAETSREALPEPTTLSQPKGSEVLAETSREALPEPTKIKVRVVKKPTYVGIKWADLYDVDSRSVTNEMHRSSVSRMQREVFNLDDSMFYYEVFTAGGAYDRVMEYFKLREFKFNTQKKYLGGLCKMLASTTCGIQCFFPYEKMYNLVKNTIAVKSDKLLTMGAEDPAVDFVVELVPKFEKVYSNATAGLAVRIYSLIALHSVDWRAETVIGVLRFDDLIKTKFLDDGKSSYIDLDARRWLLRMDVTKNAETREIMLSAEFVDHLIGVYGSVAQRCNLNDKGVPVNGSLLVNEVSGKPYDTCSGPSQQVSTHIGHSPKEIRSSYASYLYRENVPMDLFQRICSNMGHAHLTSIRDYIKGEND